MASDAALGDVAQLTMGQSPPGSTYNTDGEGLPFFQGVADFGTRHPTARVYCTAPTRVADSGDILFSVRAPIGRVNIANTKCATGRGLAILRPRDPRDARYIEFVLRSLEASWSRLEGGGSVFGNATKKDLETLAIPWPEPMERQAIGEVLAGLDDKVELNRRMARTLEEMARALFKSWFVDFDPVRAKAEGRDPGLPKHLADPFPDRLVDSELGEIPRGWDLKTLGDVVSELEVGGRPKGGVAGYATGVPSIGAESVLGLGRFDYSKTKYVPRTFFDQMKKGHIRNGDVILYKDGGKPGQFEPHVSMFGGGFPFGECAINEHVYRVRVDDIGQEFLYLWLSSDLLLEEMRRKGTGVAIPGLNSTQVRSLTVLMPSDEVAAAFRELVAPMVGGVLVAAVEQRRLAEVRDALLSKLISGAVRIPDPEGLLARLETVA
jgi:type I restriction enzyme S subunit